MTEFINISPAKFYKMLEMSNFDIEYNINNVPDYIIEWIKPIEDIGIDSTRYALILYSMDSYQWKNFYIYLYSRWERCISELPKKEERLPVYSESINYNETLKTFLNKDISKILFFINSLQIFFIPYPN